MRNVCFVDRYELDFKGNVLQNAVCLGDVDNDGRTELVVGSVSGTLAVFKDEKLWQRIEDVGMITCLSVGDLMHCGSNALVVICGDGWCHIYLCLKSGQDDEGGKLELVHSQRIPPNSKVIVLGDVQGDGQVDMALGLTDRVVRIYKWLQTPSTAKLVCLTKCESANQIGSLCISKNSNQEPCVLVSQPGGTYMSITPKEDGNAQVDYHVISTNNKSTAKVNSELVGNIGERGLHALVALDGSIMVIHQRRLLWEHNLEQQLFAAGKAKICMEGGEQLVVCSWSGNTYILDEEGCTVCFQMKEPVQAFTTGIYTNNAPAFVYVTFDNKILVFHDVSLRSMKIYSLYYYQSRLPIFKSLSREELRKLTSYLLYKQRFNHAPYLE